MHRLTLINPCPTWIQLLIETWQLNKRKHTHTLRASWQEIRGRHPLKVTSTLGSRQTHGIACKTKRKQNFGRDGLMLRKLLNRQQQHPGFAWTVCQQRSIFLFLVFLQASSSRLGGWGDYRRGARDRCSHAPLLREYDPLYILLDRKLQMQIASFVKLFCDLNVILMLLAFERNSPLYETDFLTVHVRVVRRGLPIDFPFCFTFSERPYPCFPHQQSWECRLKTCTVAKDRSLPCC